jgi:hypothetical protein
MVCFRTSAFRWRPRRSAQRYYISLLIGHRDRKASEN